MQKEAFYTFCSLTKDNNDLPFACNDTWIPIKYFIHVIEIIANIYKII